MGAMNKLSRSIFFFTLSTIAIAIVLILLAFFQQRMDILTAPGVIPTRY